MTRTVASRQLGVLAGRGWTSQGLLEDKAGLSYALEGARDNTEMVSFNSRFKNENRSLLVEAGDLVKLEKVVMERMVYYNGERRYSALGNQAPMSYVRALQASSG